MVFQIIIQKKFRFGVNNRSNVSCLSPYITHRLIEYETAKLVLKNILSKVDNLFKNILESILERMARTKTKSMD